MRKRGESEPRRWRIQRGKRSLHLENRMNRPIRRPPSARRPRSSSAAPSWSSAAALRPSALAVALRPDETAAVHAQEPKPRPRRRSPTPTAKSADRRGRPRRRGQDRRRRRDRATRGGRRRRRTRRPPTPQIADRPPPASRVDRHTSGKQAARPRSALGDRPRVRLVRASSSHNEPGLAGHGRRDRRRRLPGAGARSIALIHLVPDAQGRGC